MTRLTCPECLTQFDTADRAGPTTPAGSEAQIIYCSTACKDRARNRRFYQAHREEIVQKELERQQRKRKQTD